MRIILAYAILILLSAHSFASEAAEALVEELGITTYTATREADDIYETYQGYVVRTRYCYVFAYSETVVITDEKIIFIDSDDVCDVEAIYRK